MWLLLDDLSLWLRSETVLDAVVILVGLYLAVQCLKWRMQSGDAASWPNLAISEVVDDMPRAVDCPKQLSASCRHLLARTHLRRALNGEGGLEIPRRSGQSCSVSL